VLAKGGNDILALHGRSYNTDGTSHERLWPALRTGIAADTVSPPSDGSDMSEICWRGGGLSQAMRVDEN
jgi:hypothetical protein